MNSSVDARIEDAREPDIEQIQQVAAASWRATYKDIFSPGFISRFIEAAYATDGLRRSVANPDAIFLVARVGRLLIGFAHAGPGEDTGHTTLYRLYLLPEYWRKGIGRMLLERLEQRLAARGISGYSCYVHKANEVGKGFYRKQGFVHDPAHDREDEWYMYKQLPTAGGR